MGKVRPFCRNSLEANILRPYCGLPSVNFFIIMVCNILIHFIAPHADRWFDALCSVRQRVGVNRWHHSQCRFGGVDNVQAIFCVCEYSYYSKSNDFARRSNHNNGSCEPCEQTHACTATVINDTAGPTDAGILFLNTLPSLVNKRCIQLCWLWPFAEFLSASTQYQFLSFIWKTKWLNSKREHVMTNHAALLAHAYT